MIVDVLDRKNNPLKTLKTSVLYSHQTGDFLIGLTCDLGQKYEIFPTSFYTLKVFEIMFGDVLDNNNPS